MADAKKGSFRIERTYAVHKLGTKFYQIVKIITPNRCVVVTHWGKWSNDSSLNLRSGQTQIFPCKGDIQADFSFKEKLTEKEERGYKGWVTLPTENAFRNIDEFKTRIFGVFKGGDTSQIVSHLVGAGGTVPLDVEPDMGLLEEEQKTEVKLKKAKKEVEPDRGKDWGTW